MKMTFEQIESSDVALTAIGRELERKLALRKTKFDPATIYTEAGPKTHLGLARTVLTIIQDTAFSLLKARHRCDFIATHTIKVRDTIIPVIIKNGNVAVDIDADEYDLGGCSPFIATPIKQAEPVNYPVEVLTGGYENAHGKKPRGVGSWAFEIGGTQPGAEFWQHGVSYGAAVKAAKQEARRQGARFIRVCS